MTIHHTLSSVINSMRSTRGKLSITPLDYKTLGGDNNSRHTLADIKEVFNEIEELWRAIDEFAISISPYRRLHPFNNFNFRKTDGEDRYDALVYKNLRKQFFNFRWSRKDKQCGLTYAQYKYLCDIRDRCKVKVNNIMSHPVELAEINRLID